MHERDVDGIWWVPGGAAPPVGGRLTFSPAVGLRLQTIGQLVTDLEAARSANIPIVFGTIASLETGNDVTLCDVWRESGKSQGRYTEQKFAPMLAILGAHVEHTQTKTCEVAYSQLGPWLIEGGFDLEIGDEGGDFDYRVTFRDVKLPLVATPRLDLKFRITSAPPLAHHRWYPLKEHVTLHIDPHDPLPFEDFRHKYLWRFQNFLTFATDQPAAITRVRASLVDISRPVEIIFKHPFLVDKEAHPVHMLFTYRDVAPRISDVIEQWFRVCDDLGPALTHILAPLYGHYEFADTRFLAVAQAAESYHRRRFPISDSVVTEHRERVARLLPACAKGDAKWLEGKLKYAYEPFFTERLFALLGTYDDDFLLPMFSTPSERKSAVWGIAEWRNKLTHLSVSPEQIDDALFELTVFSNQLLTVLKASILRELGFTNADLQNCFRYNDTYRLYSRRQPSA